MRDEDVRLFRVQLKLLQRRLRREQPPPGGLSRTALQALGAVTRLPEGPQPRQIAHETQMTSSNTAAALRQLETAGLIRREKDPADARQVRVFVTAHGDALLADVRGERDTWLGRAVEALLDEEEQRQLLAAGRLIQRLAEYDPPSGPSSTPEDRS